MSYNKRNPIILVLVIAALLLSACTTAIPAVTEPAGQTNTESTDVVHSGPKEVILATTTSTRDSGLLDALIPVFESQSGYMIKMIAVGTGQALKMGEEGNADVLLVHAPASEVTFMEGGFGKDRYLVMHNDFIIVGPADDPAGIKGMTAIDAYKSIAAAGTAFVSRGDDSGTHKSELAIWKKAELEPTTDNGWYLSTGGGMGDSLRVATEKQAYIFTDRATYLSLKDTLELDILVEGDVSLLNIYHVITVNPDKFPAVNADGGNAFAEFMVASDTQNIIGEFGVDKYGSPLFFPDAGKNEESLGK